MSAKTPNPDTTLLVPIHLDGLFVDANGMQTAPPLVDFTSIDSDDQPYLGAQLTAKPFSTGQADSHLTQGVHLHWALPDALTQTMHIPLVRKQSFLNIFGTDKGANIWQSLISKKWISPLGSPATTARVLKDRKDRTIPPAGIAPDQLNVVNGLLDHPSFPAVPNRWLVTRLASDGSTPEKQWVVESDYIWPDKTNDNQGNSLNNNYTAYPAIGNNNPSEKMDYCFIGRWYELGQSPAGNGQYLPDPLTAVGYGEPSFAAFYPNCRSVFGFHDAEITDISKKPAYEVLGWYSDPSQDYYKLFLDSYINGSDNQGYPYTQLLAAIRNEFQWFIPITIHQKDFGNGEWELMKNNGWLELTSGTDTAVISGAMVAAGSNLGVGNEKTEKTIRDSLESFIQKQIPGQMLCYARGTAGLTSQSQPANSEEIVLAAGNNNTEALSAFLAQKISPTEKAKIEDYLEAIQLSSKLHHQKSDLGPKFKEARQGRGFVASPGGSLWTVRTQSSTNKKADATETAEEITLPEVIADVLNELNKSQQEYDRLSFRIDTLREQIFADWCRYLLQDNTIKNAPPPPPSGGSNIPPPPPDSDPNTPPPPPGNNANIPPPPPGSSVDVPPPPPPTNGGSDIPPPPPPNPTPTPGGNGGQNNRDQEIEDLKNMQAFIEWEVDTALKDLQDQQNDIQNDIQQNIELLKDLLNQFKASQPDSDQKNSNYVVQQTAAPRFWNPTDPALLITGIQSSSRHGQDGRLRSDHLLACTPEDIPATPTAPNAYSAIHSTLEAIKQAQPDNFALNPQPEEWHPLFMDWKIEFKQAKNINRSHHPYDNGYDDAYLNRNYGLNLNSVNLEPLNPPENLSSLTPSDSIPFLGRNILTPASQHLQRDALAQVLVPAIIEAAKAALKTDDLTKDQFNNLVKDTQLSQLMVQESYQKISDQQLITDSLQNILVNKIDGLPTVVSWYWTQTLQTIKTQTPKAPAPDTQFDQFIDWVIPRTQLKTTYYQQNPKIKEEDQDDFHLQNDPNFIPWLKSEVGKSLNVFLKEMGGSGSANSDQYLQDNFNTLISWYQNRARGLLHDVLNYYAYKELNGSHGMSQSLGSFNQTLLTKFQSFQLNIASPDTDDKTLAFTAKVRNAVQGKNSCSPITDGDFSPLRAGQMKVSNLKLVNTFGQFWPPAGQSLVDRNHQLICTDAMTNANDNKAIILTPRLSQAARLNFRWLSAHPSTILDKTFGTDLVEMNSHPASSPICGWVLPNNLDNSLMVYHQNGQALGYVDEMGNWRVFPGHDGPVLVQDIDNAHLSAMVARLCRLAREATAGISFIPSFLATLGMALDSIAPDNSPQHDALSLLMGRPIALVRATLQLEQKGDFAVNQRAFRSDVGKYGTAKLKAGNNPVSPDSVKRNNYYIDEVKIPLRLGEFRQLNDGLVGYWIDELPAGSSIESGSNAGTVNEDTFFAPQSFDPNTQHPNILTHQENGAPFVFNLTFAQEAPVEISMLLDPRGKVHATCGLLPVKNIHLPPDQYKQALASIEVAFLSTPVLSLAHRMHISLPNEPGYGWSWVEKEEKGWKTINSIGQISLQEVSRVFPAEAGTIWALLVSKGWIKTTIGDNATVVPKDQRTTQDLGKDHQSLQPVIEAMLDRTQINPFDATASFSGRPIIHEGWLKLSKENLE